MSGYFILAILALAFLVTFQIAKASEYVSVLKGEEKTFQQNNGSTLSVYRFPGTGTDWCLVVQ